MIKVKCHTNLDDWKHVKWPTDMCCRPMIGDKVHSRAGGYLTICSIAHTWVSDDRVQDALGGPSGYPRLDIELNK